MEIISEGATTLGERDAYVRNVVRQFCNQHRRHNSHAVQGDHHSE